MSQHHHGRRLAGDDRIDLRGALLLALASAGGLLLARAIDPTALESLTAVATGAFLAAAMVGKDVGRALLTRLIRRRERRLGRRFYRTIGEPEKIVWTSLPSLPGISA
jgi:hypothetical protein